jgi:hypothetical protein
MPLRPALRRRGRVPLSPRQRLHVNVLRDVRDLAVQDGSGKDEMVIGTSSEAI